MRHYFLTGATGVVGSAFLKKIAQRHERVTLLLRAKTPAEAENRQKALLALLAIDQPAAQQIDAVAGDLYGPKLGLNEEIYARIASNCTHIVHCAGNVYMNLPLAEARRQTLGMSQGMLSLMEDSTTAEKMEFVSTVGVSGHTPGDIPETWLDHPRSFRNTYEAAKAEAETLVRQKISSGRSITVHRPSMVVGDSKTGQTASFQVFYHLCEFLSGARSKGFIPNVGQMRLDIIPADYVAAVLDWSSRQRHLSAPVLHACSGRQGAIPLHKLIREVRRIFIANGRRLPKLTILPMPLFQMLLRLIRPLIPARDRRALDALPFFFAYLKEDQSFANQQTLKLVGAEGIALPRAEEYLGKVLGYYLKQKKRTQL